MIPSIVSFDVETTGLQPFSERIIELAAVRWRDGAPVETFQSLVDPRRPIDPGAIAVHGITDADVAGAPGIESVLPAFCEFAGTDPLAAHNAGFDTGFLTMESLRAGVALRERRVLDTLTLARHAFRGLRSFRLESLSAQLDLGAEEHHRALADAMTAGRLLYAALEKGGEAPKAAWSMLRSADDLKLPVSLHCVQEALERACDVSIDYQTAKGFAQDYLVRPIALVRVMNRPYLYARCRRSEEERTYRIDRIRGARLPAPPETSF